MRRLGKTEIRRVSKFQQYAKSLSPAAEFCIVVGGAFALPIASSLWAAFTLSPAQAVQITNVEIEYLVIQEALVLFALAWFLRVRGWSIEHFPAFPPWRELVQALGLTLAAYLVWVGPWMLLNPADAAAPAVNFGLSWGHILAVSIINPLFEEAILCAYMIPFLAQRRGLAVAMAVSLVVRLSFHTYQGALALPSIALLGLVLSGYFARTRRLWPVLIAHGALDVIGLANS
jgi:uncharacterized protein